MLVKTNILKIVKFFTISNQYKIVKIFTISKVKVSQSQSKSKIVKIFTKSIYGRGPPPPSAL